VYLQEFQRPIVYPSLPYQKLWDDAIERIGIKKEKKALNRRWNKLNKYSVHIDNHFDNNPLPIKTIMK